MFWQKSATFAIGCAAALAGVVIAARFMLILSAPFIGGYSGASFAARKCPAGSSELIGGARTMCGGLAEVDRKHR